MSRVKMLLVRYSVVTIGLFFWITFIACFKKNIVVVAIFGSLLLINVITFFAIILKAKRE